MCCPLGRGPRGSAAGLRAGDTAGQVTPWHCVHASCWALQGLTGGAHERGVPAGPPDAAPALENHRIQHAASQPGAIPCCVPCLGLAPLLAALLPLLLGDQPLGMLERFLEEPQGCSVSINSPVRSSRAWLLSGLSQAPCRANRSPLRAGGAGSAPGGPGCAAARRAAGPASLPQPPGHVRLLL